MNTKEFFLNSGDGESKLHAIKWLPEGEPKSVLQIVHGMAEYVERYTPFAEFMAKQGYFDEQAIAGNTQYVIYKKVFEDYKELDEYLEENAKTLGEVYEKGFNIGHCGLTSRYIARRFEEANMYCGKAKLLVGTKIHQTKNMLGLHLKDFL